MRLTMRQKAFLSRMLDLYAAAHEPLHYSRVAETLGVSPSTAYDMLRVLERKDMVRSDYTLGERPAGPGRASIVFVPTAQAHELFARLAAESGRDEEWEEVKARVLTALRRGRATDRAELLSYVLAQMPQTNSPLAYAAEVITALLLTLRAAKHRFGPRSPLAMILDNTAGRFGMSMLVGLAFGLSATQRANDRLLANLPQLIGHYEAAVQDLTAERVQALRDFVGEMVVVLRAEGH